MDLKGTIDIIIKDLNDIRLIVDDLKQYQGVPAFEIELAKSKCRSVIEIISFLRDNSSFPVVPKKVIPEIHEESPAVKAETSRGKEEMSVGKEEYMAVKKESAEKKEENPAGKEESVSEEMVIEVEIPSPVHEVHEPVKPVIRSQADGSAGIMVEGEPIPAGIPKAPEFTIIADQYANRPESFNEKLGSMKHDDDVLELIKAKPVSTLSEAIGINDKYLLIKEIFNGDQESYNQVLLRLESAGCLDDAKAIIMTYAGDKRENEAFKMFVNILKRKFPPNE
ncbi:MAG: hypothetical protein GYA41_11645 [Bacteroidales bacterium]|nr:hypothetical protein [Bacteroidales bacterium]